MRSEIFRPADAGMAAYRLRKQDTYQERLQDKALDIPAARGQGHRDPAQVAEDRRQQPFRVQPARRGIRPVGHRQAEQRKIDKEQEHPAVAQKRRDKDGVKIQPDDTRGQTHIRRTGLEERDGRAHDKPPDGPFVKPCHREGLCRVPAGHNQHDRPRAA